MWYSLRTKTIACWCRELVTQADGMYKDDGGLLIIIIQFYPCIIGSLSILQVSRAYIR